MVEIYGSYGIGENCVSDDNTYDTLGRTYSSYYDIHEEWGSDACFGEFDHTYIDPETLYHGCHNMTIPLNYKWDEDDVPYQTSDVFLYYENYHAGNETYLSQYDIHTGGEAFYNPAEDTGAFIPASEETFVYKIGVFFNDGDGGVYFHMNTSA